MGISADGEVPHATGYQAQHTGADIKVIFYESQNRVSPL